MAPAQPVGAWSQVGHVRERVEWDDLMPSERCGFSRAVPRYEQMRSVRGGSKDGYVQQERDGHGEVGQDIVTPGGLG